MALGAQRIDIIRLVLKSVVATVGVGMVVGLAISIGLNRVVAHRVQSSSRDPLMLIVVAVILVMIALLACLWPAGAPCCESGPDEGVAHGIDFCFNVNSRRWRPTSPAFFRNSSQRPAGAKPGCEKRV